MSKIRTALTAVLALLVLCCAAFACGKWQKVFYTLYKPGEGTEVRKAKCLICHITRTGKDKKLNVYGAMLKGKKISASSLKAIENKDADGDKFSNVAEIKAGTLPGDRNSKPSEE